MSCSRSRSRPNGSAYSGDHSCGQVQFGGSSWRRECASATACWRRGTSHAGGGDVGMAMPRDWARAVSFARAPLLSARSKNRFSAACWISPFDSAEYRGCSQAARGESSPALVKTQGWESPWARASPWELLGEVVVEVMASGGAEPGLQ